MLNNTKLSFLQPASTPANPYNRSVVGPVFTTIISGGTGYMLAKKAFEADSLQLSTSSQSVNQILLRHSLASTAGSAIAYGLFSLGKQLNAVSQGGQDSKGAMANIAADTLLGLSAGVGAGTLGSLSTLGMRAMGATGFLGMAVSVVGGAVGGVIGHAAFSASGVREKLLTAFGSQKTGPLPEPGY